MRMVIKTKEEHLKKQTLLKQRKKHVLLKVKQRQGAELKECLYETAIPAGEDEQNHLPFMQKSGQRKPQRKLCSRGRILLGRKERKNKK